MLRSLALGAFIVGTGVWDAFGATAAPTMVDKALYCTELYLEAARVIAAEGEDPKTVGAGGAKPAAKTDAPKAEAASAPAPGGESSGGGKAAAAAAPTPAEPVQTELGSRWAEVVGGLVEQQAIAALGPTSQLAPAIKLKLDALGS
mgnify:CR=1 FL=1